ncbi:hypothetical protein [Mycetocola sp.]|uniref:hypothetical protein n=1 Tax=Mycetocola sp. TaxID=1871042 RepID=UPI00398A1300
MTFPEATQPASREDADFAGTPIHSKLWWAPVGTLIRPRPIALSSLFPGSAALLTGRRS